MGRTPEPIGLKILKGNGRGKGHCRAADSDAAGVRARHPRLPGVAEPRG